MTAIQTREAELKVLESEGARVVHVNRRHCRIGSIHLWSATQRWMNEATNERGKFNYTPLRQLIERELQVRS
jgi:hypothetical protein